MKSTNIVEVGRIANKITVTLYDDDEMDSCNMAFLTPEDAVEVGKQLIRRARRIQKIANAVRKVTNKGK